jgi:hypothetical protein
MVELERCCLCFLCTSLLSASQSSTAHFGAIASPNANSPAQNSSYGIESSTQHLSLSEWEDSAGDRRLKEHRCSYGF